MDRQASSADSTVLASGLQSGVESGRVLEPGREDRAEMVGNIRSYLRSTQRQPAVVKRFFEAEEVAYAAA